jgi:hypothetical protein
VVVVAGEARGRERLGHQDRRGAVAAADVGDDRAGLQLLDHAVERRQPVGDQMGAVVGGERPLRAVEQVVVVLVPADAAARLKALGDPLPAVDGGDRALDHPREVERAIVVGEHERVLDRQRVPVRLRVVGHVAAGRLGVEPLAHVALAGLGARGQPGGADRLPVGHRLVEAELVADRHQRRVERRADLAGHLVHERLEPCFVDEGKCSHGRTVRPRRRCTLRLS